ncbi:MAG: hypothetical protein JO356_12610, partial [Acidobacteria bacterium]|nr:hypothetical protein [Acidobacteriota bacterium]
MAFDSILFKHAAEVLAGRCCTEFESFTRLGHRLMMPANTSSIGPVFRGEFRLTLRLALPLIVAEVGWMSMGVVDTMMVGRLPHSAIAIGATGLGQSLYSVVSIFGAGLLLGMDSFVARAWGREDLPDARNTLLNGLTL